MNGEGLVRSLYVRAAGLEREVDHRAEAHQLAADRELAARDARDVEEIVDEPRHLVDLAVDHRARPFELRREAALLGEQRDRVADRRERVAQLVRQHGEELVLAPVGFAQRLLRLLALVNIGNNRYPAVWLAVGVEDRLRHRVDPARAEAGEMPGTLVLHATPRPQLLRIRLERAHALLADHLADVAADER